MEIRPREADAFQLSEKSSRPEEPAALGEMQEPAVRRTTPEDRFEGIVVREGHRAGPNLRARTGKQDPRRRRRAVGKPCPGRRNERDTNEPPFLRLARESGRRGAASDGWSNCAGGARKRKSADEEHACDNRDGARRWCSYVGGIPVSPHVLAHRRMIRRLGGERSPTDQRLAHPTIRPSTIASSMESSCSVAS